MVVLQPARHVVNLSYCLCAWLGTGAEWAPGGGRADLQPAISRLSLTLCPGPAQPPGAGELHPALPSRQEVDLSRREGPALASESSYFRSEAAVRPGNDPL